MRFLLIMAKRSTYIFTLLILTILFSCKKKDSNDLLGLDVQPENDLLGITVADSSSVFMYTQQVDSTRTFNDQYKYLGSTIDPVLGRTDASIYTNFSITNNLTNVSFGANPVLDSAEMIIKYTGNYLGDTTTSLSFDVYLLNEMIQTSTAYYTNKDFTTSTVKVGTYTGKLKTRDGAACLVIPIDNNFAQQVLQTESNLTNNIAFQNAYKGFFITSKNTALSSGTGSVRRFDLDNTISGVKLYYHDGNSINAKGESFLFGFRGTDALRTNRIAHNYSSALQTVRDQITKTDTTQGNTNIFINSFGGTRARVYLPFMNNFVDSQNVSISRAELIVKVDGVAGNNSNYAAPAGLALIGSGSTNTEELVWDQVETTDFLKYGGYYDAVNKQYVFNIARQMQKVITGKIPNYGFYLVNADPNRSIVVRRDNRLDRVVLGGKNNTGYKAIFKVTYVKFPYDK